MVKSLGLLFHRISISQNKHIFYGKESWGYRNSPIWKFICYFTHFCGIQPNLHIITSETHKYFPYSVPQQIPFLFQLARGHSAHEVYKATFISEKERKKKGKESLKIFYLYSSFTSHFILTILLGRCMFTLLQYRKENIFVLGWSCSTLANDAYFSLFLSYPYFIWTLNKQFGCSILIIWILFSEILLFK